MQVLGLADVMPGPGGHAMDIQSPGLFSVYHDDKGNVDSSKIYSHIIKKNCNMINIF